MTKLFPYDIGHEPKLEPDNNIRFPICPICGDNTDTFYKDANGDIVGCSECMERVDAWEYVS